MKVFSMLRGAAALVAAIAALSVLSGCAGGGGNGGSGAQTAPQVIKNNGTFEGNMGPAAGISRGTTPSTSFTIRFDATGGAAAFKSGTFGSTNFVTYTADVTNVVIIEDQAGDGSTGSISFDMTNFTSGSPFQSLHWAGTYQWNKVEGNGAGLNINGQVTGTDVNENPVSLFFTMGYSFYPNIVAFTGDWQGDIDIPTVGVTPWSGSFVKIDDTHTNVNINYGDQVITVPAVTTNTSLAGDFDGSAFVAGAVGHFYLQRDPEFNDNDHLVGAFTVTLGGAPLGGGVIHAIRTTVAPIHLNPASYYQGTMTPSGGTAMDLKLDLMHIGSTPGVQGGATVNPSGNPLFGARILTVTNGTSNSTVTLGNVGFTQVSPSFNGRYDSITFVGTPTLTTYSGTYTANLTGGGTESGTFSTNLVTTAQRFDLGGTWSGSASGSNGTGTPNTFSGTINQTEDEFQFSATQTVSGQAVDFTINGYIVNNNFVGDVVNQAVTISGLSGTITGHFEGTVAPDGNHITGEFFYTATVPGLGSSTDNGTFTLVKQ